MNKKLLILSVILLTPTYYYNAPTATSKVKSSHQSSLQWSTNYQPWIDYALNDLHAAQELTTINSAYNNIATYLAQQATEKALKAFIISIDKTAKIKTHDLVALLELCAATNSQFTNFKYHTEQLNPYSMTSRYPQELTPILNSSNTKKLIHLSEEIVNFVIKTIQLNNAA